MKTLSFSADGEISSDIQYYLEGSPCEQATLNGIRAHPYGVADRFPRDVALRKKSIEGYVGVGLFDSENRPIGIMAAMYRNPITDIHLAESILQIFAARAGAEIERRRVEEERHRLAMAIEQAGEHIVITDTEGVIQYANPSFERTTGFNSKEAVGNTLRILKSGKHDETFYEQLWRTIKAGRVWTGHITNKKKDGTLFEEEATISPLKDRSGKIVNFVAVKRDVTNEQALRQQLFRAQKMEAIGTLAGGVAHDFNNLLQVIQGHADIGLIRMQKDDPFRQEFTEIKRTARTAAELTQGLLTFSRRAESRLRPVAMNQELKQVVKMLNRTTHKMIRIELDLADDLKTVRADPAQIQQVMMNLAVNSRDAMPDGGTLQIESKNVVLDQRYCESQLAMKPGEYIVVTVSDSGCGVDNNTVNHIYEPFFTTKATGKGTGLGLSIVYGIIKSHGGNITCYSEPERGTVFNIYLPVISEQAELSESTREETIPGGDETILVVDDEKPLRKLAQRILADFGYSVVVASNGREALDRFLEDPSGISLVLLDLIMPEMNGMECLEEILKSYPDAKVIVASGYASRDRIDDALKKGAKATIRKPYEAGSMLKLVRRVLDQD
ncbi:response regulator [Thermodesulfobacteriota bacterium]